MFDFSGDYILHVLHALHIYQPCGYGLSSYHCLLLEPFHLVRTGDFGSEVEKISVNYADHSYTVSALNNKINIVKKAVADVYA